jgi:hypothetical protein
MSKKRKVLEGLRRRLYSNRLLEGKEILIREDSGEKMSEVLFKFIEPYMEFASSRNNLEKLLIVAVIAWNASLIPKEEREAILDEEINSTLSFMDEDLVKDFKAILYELIQRKEILFSENRSFIFDYELTGSKGKYYLSVASMIQGS